MARPTEWRRLIGEYVEGATKSNQHFLQLPSIDEGETLGRLRLTFQALHDDDVLFSGGGLVVAFGVNVVPAGTSTGAMDYPADNPSADWVWWEAGILQPSLAVRYSTFDFEVDVYPTGDCLRDVRAQRKADVGGSDVWFQSQTTSLSPGQSDHYLTVNVSMLVILP